MAEKPVWKQLEARIQNEAPTHGVTCWQVPTQVRIINKNGIKFPVPIKSLPDFAAGVFGFAAFFDAKSTQETSWNLQDYVFRKDSSSNKLHQWEKLLNAHETGNI